jgi:hypothetical protein
MNCAVADPEFRKILVDAIGDLFLSINDQSAGDL